MQTADIVLGIPLLWGLYKGFRNGIIAEIAGLLAMVLALWGWSMYSEKFMSFFRTRTLGPHTPFVLSIISFIIVFVVILVIVQLISLRFEKLSDYLHLGLANQILGALFGLLKWAFLLSLFIYVFNLLNHHFLFQKGDKYYNSWLYEHISQIVPMLLPKLSK